MWQHTRLIEDGLAKFRNNYKELALIIYKQQKQIQFHETKALHLAFFYIASQLLIFLSNSSNPSPDQCRNWWKPFSVSILIATAFGLNFTTTIIKYIEMKYGQERNFIDQQENYHQMSYLERNWMRNREGDDMSQLEIDLTKEYIKQEQHEPDLVGVCKRYVHIGVTCCALLTFTILVLDSCRVSVCADAR